MAQHTGKDRQGPRYALEVTEDQAITMLQLIAAADRTPLAAEPEVQELYEMLANLALPEPCSWCGEDSDPEMGPVARFEDGDYYHAGCYLSATGQNGMGALYHALHGEGGQA